MGSIKRVVSVEFWNDDTVVDNFSPEDKLFMLYLLTNPHSSQLGIYNINKKLMAFEIGYSVEAVTVLLDRFQSKYGMIRYSETTHEVAVKNYLRHSILKGGKPVEDLLHVELDAVKDRSLIRYVFDHVRKYPDLNETVKKVIKQYYDSLDESCNESSDDTTPNENDNDNGNDNDIKMTMEASAERNKSRSTPTAEKHSGQPVFEIPTNDGDLYPVYQDDVDKWSELYQAVDVPNEIRKMIGWSDGNPGHRKTRRGMRRFIVSWLCREQDKGGAHRPTFGKSASTPDPRKTYDSIEDFY